MELGHTWIGTLGWMHLVGFGLWIPFLAIRTGLRIDKAALPPKKRYFVTVLVQLAIFAAFSIAVARGEWIPLFPPRAPSAASIAAGLGALAGMIALARPMWRRRVAERSRKVWLFMPRDAAERALWVANATAAGFGEEITYRGVLFVLLWRLTGSALAGALLSAVAFSIGHYLQGWKSMGIIFGIALIFQGLTWLSGSLYVAIAVHALYDIAAGLHYGKFGRELGYPVEAPPVEPPKSPAPAM